MQRKHLDSYLKKAGMFSGQWAPGGSSGETVSSDKKTGK